MMKIVGLVRVSTERQELSGLGLEAQYADIERLRGETGSQVLKIYKETESGMHDDIESRPQLMAAVAHTKRAKAVLVFARFDRLVRSTHVMDYLKMSGIRFMACDNPHANELLIDILVAVAAEEGRKISQRTKAALAARRARGEKLGAEIEECRNLTAEARARGTANSVASRKAKAVSAYEDLADFMWGLRDEEKTLVQIADALTADGQTTARNRPWNATQVMRVLDRFPRSVN
jgi:DNA invertase Pin-like site-specific DNA recombinase